MKTIRIFAVPSHAAVERVSGVDFTRVIQPMQFLGREPGFKVTIYNPKLNEKMDWLKVTAENDILFLNYTTNPWSFAIMGCLARKHKRKIVLDMDDALHLVRQDNTAYNVFKKGSEGIKNFTAICNEVDWVTTTTPYLKNVICHYTLKRHEQVAVLPNYIDLETLYTHRSKPKDDHIITICHFGSSSHFKDLQDQEFVRGMDKLMKELPNVQFLSVGALIPKFKQKWGERYMHDFGDTDIYKWIQTKFPKFMDKSDIVIAPLEVDTYNRGKSWIKFLEYSSAKKPGIYQRIYPYEQIVKHGINGYLASSAEDWYNYLKKLALDFEHRKEIGEKAFQTIQDYTIQKNIYKFSEFFKKVMVEG